MHQAWIVLWSGQKEGSLSPQRPLKAPLNDLKIPLNARKYPYNIAPQLSKNGPVFTPWNGGEDGRGTVWPSQWLSSTQRSIHCEARGLRRSSCTEFTPFAVVL